MNLSSKVATLHTEWDGHPATHGLTDVPQTHGRQVVVGSFNHNIAYQSGILGIEDKTAGVCLVAHVFAFKAHLCGTDRSKVAL